MDFIILKQCKETFVKMQSIQELLCCAVDMDYPQLLGRPKLLKQLRCADIIRLHRLAQARGSQASKGAAATGHGCLQVHMSETGFLDESSVDDA